MLRPEDILARYGAARATLMAPDGPLCVEGPGGGLAEAVREQGLGLLSGLLSAWPEAVEVLLEDGGSALALRRVGEGAELDVRWAGGERLVSRVELAPHPEVAAPERRPRFTPDPASRLDLREALRGGGALAVVEEGGAPAFYGAGRPGGVGGLPLLARLPASGPLGPAAFREAMGLRHNYVAGAMAGGVGSADIVIAMARAGMLGFFGAGGLPLAEVEAAVEAVQAACGGAPAGFNLLHNPVEPEVEEATAALYLRRGVRFVSASAYMRITPAIVRYRYHGIHQDAQGRVVCPNRVFAKVSHPVVASQFLKPASAALLDELVGRGQLSAEEAALAATWPMCDALTCEADSGGHTDRRPLMVILPAMLALRAAVAKENHYDARGARIFIGAAGGLGTPQALRAAFAMGADYVLTGSVNQASREAGTSDEVKALLAQADLSDVAMGPAPDMFEIGAEVQVLSRGTMYAQRARRLYELYKRHAAWSEVPEAEARRVEGQILGRPFDEVWQECRRYWGARDPKQIEKAERDPRHAMALVFRWYLGMTSRWARQGEAARRRDYQIWCGPAMGGFNTWVAGTALEPLAARGVVDIAEALLDGARALARAEALAAQGLALPADEVLRAVAPPAP